MALPESLEMIMLGAKKAAESLVDREVTGSSGTDLAGIRGATDRAQVAALAHEFLWNSTTDALFLMRANERGVLFETANLAYRRLNNLQKRDIAASYPTDCLPIDVARTLSAKCRACLATGNPVEFDDFDPATGKSRHTSLRPLRDEITGNVVRIIGRQKEVPTPNALLNASIDSLSAHVVILDAAGTIVASNQAWQRFAGRKWPKRFKRESTPNLFELFEKAEHKSSRLRSIGSGLRALLAGRRTTIRHIYQLNRGGAGRWFQTTAVRFLHGGRPFAAMTTEDVTDVRAARKALSKLSERLLTLQEDERLRIAVELHNSTAQHLAAIGLNAMSLKARSTGDPVSQKLWEDVDHSLEEATRELRALTFLLHPTRLDEEGLNAALRRYVEGFGTRTGVTVNVELDSHFEDLPVALRRSLLRIVQEALTNVHHRSLASHVFVREKLTGNRLLLTIRDNGCRVARTSLKRERAKSRIPAVGIPGMRERLRQWGGELEIRSGSRGTTVNVTVPRTGRIAKSTAQSSIDGQ